MLTLWMTIAAVALTPAASAREEESARWQADARALYSDIVQNHPQALRRSPRAAWQAAAERLVARAPQLDWPTYVVEMSRLLALAEDGHTNVFPPQMPGPGFDGMYPVQLFRFSDGVYATRAGPGHENLAGRRVVAINGTPAEKAFERAAAIAGGDNPLGRLSVASLVLASPGLVRGLGLSDSTGVPLRLTVKDPDGLRQIDVPAVTWDQADPSQMIDLLAKTWNNSSLPVPLGSGPNIGLTPLPNNGLLVTYRAVSNEDGDSIEDFAHRLRTALDSGTIERLIVDIRANRGGNNTLNPPLVSAIKDSGVDRCGRLFILTGRDTFSAAMNFATAMERQTKALFVGEPTGGAPNHSGDPDVVVLPATKFAYRRSTLYWQDSDPADDRVWIMPDIAAPPSFSMIQSGRDLAIEAALAYRWRPVKLDSRKRPRVRC